MADKAARALNELNRCGIHGVSVDFNTLLDNALDYFDIESDQESDTEGLDYLGGEEAILEIVNIPENPKYESVMKELENAEQETGRHIFDHNNDSDSENNSESEQEDGPTVIVDQAEAVMIPIAETLVDCDVEKERQTIVNFSCKCKDFEEGKCMKQFATDYIMNLRMNLSSVTDGEKEMYILGKISCAINLSETTECSKRKEQKVRSRYRTTFLIENKSVCRNTFKFMHCIGNDRLQKLIHAYASGEVTPLRKKSGGRIESDRLITFDDVKRVVNFLNNFAEAYAMVLPGRVPGFKRDDVKLLPSHETKMSVWRKYKVAMESSGDRAVQETSFRNIWHRLLPFIVRTRPMSDLCWMCQKNNTAIYRSASLPLVVKNAKLRKQQEHLEIVAKERSLYRDMVAASKDSATGLKLGRNDPCSKDMTVHYSFDFAQQVHLPSNPLQPGPIYFLVPRKVGIFGVNCEGVPEQINYLIDESMCSSKGSNAVISYLDHFFSTWGLGEKYVNLHCDNCSGQNKNKYVIWYLIWRTLHGQHDSITLNFMISGHTKFSPDQCFGLFKQAFRRTEVNCLDEMATCVRNSSPESGINIPQLVGNEKKDVFVPLRDWQTHLQPYFKALDGIKKLHHMRFDAGHPGVVFTKVTSDGEETAVCLLKNPARIPPVESPAAVSPPGLDLKRQWYLFTKIREFCSEATQDVTCPRPADGLPDSEVFEEADLGPTTKKKRRIIEE